MIIKIARILRKLAPRFESIIKRQIMEAMAKNPKESKFFISLYIKLRPLLRRIDEQRTRLAIMKSRLDEIEKTINFWRATNAFR